MMLSKYQLWSNKFQTKQIWHKSRSTDLSNNYTKNYNKLKMKFVQKMLTFRSLGVPIYPKHSLYSEVSSSNKELCCDHNGQDLIGLNCIWHVPHVVISFNLEHMLDETISENVSYSPDAERELIFAQHSWSLTRNAIIRMFSHYQLLGIQCRLHFMVSQRVWSFFLWPCN